MKLLITTVACVLVAFPAAAQGNFCRNSTDYSSNPNVAREFVRTGAQGGEGVYGIAHTGSDNYSLRLFSQSNTNSNVLATIPNDSRIPLFGGYYAKDNYWWWMTKYNNRIGWVRSDFVCGDPKYV
ncbi:MAG: hypothetical protein AB4062_17390 [Crocosphaera sp.]